MLQIRKEQQEEMAISDISLFLERAVNFLYENFPESLEEDSDELTEIVGEQLEKADLYGLITEQQIMTYITSAWMLGTNFDKEFPAVQENLTSEEFSPDEKTEWLAEWTKEIFASFEED